MAISVSMLMHVDNAIIIGLLAWLLATVAWRAWFRWDTGSHHVPAVVTGGVPRAMVDVHVPGRGWSWLVHGLRSAGFEVNEHVHERPVDAQESPGHSATAVIVLNRSDPRGNDELVTLATRNYEQVIIVSPPGARLANDAACSWKATGGPAGRTGSCLYWIDLVTGSRAMTGERLASDRATVHATGRRGQNAELVVTGLVVSRVARPHLNL